ncbi:MAG: DsbA family protein [Candidatus Bathyarchaeia archaeon]
MKRNVSVGIIVLVLVAAIGGTWYFFSGSISNQSGSLTTSSTSDLAVLLSSGQAPFRGSINASVTIVEFGDFQCPTCDAWYRTQEPLVLQNLINSGRVRFEWRDCDFFGPDSISASEAAYAAGEQGKFWQFYDILYSNQQTPNSGWSNSSHLQQFAEQLGLNMTQFDQSFQSGKYVTLVNSNYELGKQLGVTSTPTFFLIGPNGRVVTIVGDQPYSVFETAVNSLTGS